MKDYRIVCQIAQQAVSDFKEKRTKRHWAATMELVYLDKDVWRSVSIGNLSGECPYAYSPDFVLYTALNSLLSYFILKDKTDEAIAISTDSSKILSHVGKQRPVRTGYDFTDLARETVKLAAKFPNLKINHVDTMSLTMALLVATSSSKNESEGS